MESFSGQSAGFSVFELMLRCTAPMVSMFHVNSDRCPAWAFQSRAPQRPRFKTYCSTFQDDPMLAEMSRRHMLNVGTGLVMGYASGLISERQSMALPASKGQTPSVGSYLPPAGVEDFVEFVPGPQKTPVSLNLHSLKRLNLECSAVNSQHELRVQQNRLKTRNCAAHHHRFHWYDRRMY